ncbi:MAG: hypothetical protein R3B09_16475 [Nannocystaceae bacterium]
MGRRPLLLLALLVACKAPREGEPRPPAAAPPAPTIGGSSTGSPTIAVAPAPTFEEVERAAQEALLVDARDRAAFEALARLYFDRGVEQERGYLLLAARVIDQGERALASIGVVSPELLTLRARLELERARPDHAAEALRAALRVDPGHAVAALELARIELQLRRPREALALLEVAARAPAQALAAHLEAGAAHLALGDLAAAEAALLGARRLAPADPRVHWDLAVVALHAHDGADPPARPRLARRAAQHLEAFVDRAGDDPALAGDVTAAAAQIEALTADEAAPIEATRWDRVRLVWISERRGARSRLLELEREAEAAAKAKASAGGANPEEDVDDRRRP